MPERKSAGSGPGKSGTSRSGGRPVGRPSSRSGRSGGASNAKSTPTKPDASKPVDKPVASKPVASKPDASKVSTSKPETTTKAASSAGTSTTATKGSNAAGKGNPAGKAGTAGKGSTAAPKARPAGSGRPPNRKPPTKAKAGRGGGRGGRSIVNQKQTPWGLIITTAVVVIFAAAVVIAVVVSNKGGSSAAATTRGGQAVSSSDPYRQPEDATAAKIRGVTYRVEGEHTHIEGSIKYDRTPPVGGDHSQYWADCTGTVYKNAIANENAVHMLEHGAIWITYNKNKLTSAQVATLAKNVSGIDRMAMSPYPNLKTPISLQAWGYQLFVSSPTDPRIAQFIAALKYNKKTTPEYGATCSQPTFKADPSTFGHPLWTPKNGSSGNVMGG